MTHHYSYIDLATGISGLLQDDQSILASFRKQPGIKLFVLPYRNLKTEWKEDDRFQPLHALVKNLEKQSFQSGEWVPKADTFIRFTDPARANIDRLCETLIAERGAMGHCLVFLHGAAFRRLQNPTQFSATGFPSFLLRDDGDLRDSEGNWKDAIEKPAAWLGTGWLTLAPAAQCPDLHLACYTRIHHLIDNECNAFCERHRLSGFVDDERLPSDAEIKSTRRQVARLLTAYLPPFKERLDSPDWQVYGADAETGCLPLYGPTLWENWLDPRLGPLEQDLLFEGWLTPFEDKGSGAWTLQPASLALLFWAARVMDLRLTDDPQQFIDHHDWSGWFGNRCHWR